MFSARLQEALSAWAEHEFPKEACGLVVRVEDEDHFWACRNIASDPLKQFILNPRDYAAAGEAGEIIAICHSHPSSSAKASQADLAACEMSGLPWYIIAWPSGSLNRIAPSGFQSPLLGRQFVHGVHDCYSLIRDYYATELNIALPDFEREDHWWDKGQNLYLENFTKAGFELVTDLKKHDVVMMRLRGAPVPAHAGVYIGDNMIMHHLFDSLSRRDVYDQAYRRRTTHTVRHSGVK